MKPTLPLQEKLYNEMLSRIKEDDAEVPYKDGDISITPAPRPVNNTEFAAGRKAA